MPLEYDPMTDEETYERFRQILIPHVANNRKGRPVYASLTVSGPYTDQIRNALYLTGLASLYSNRSVDNIPLLKKNIEELYLLDYTKEYFPADISAGNVNSMNGNYLIPFAMLSKYYHSTGDATKSKYYRDRALQVATASERVAEYEALFAND
jgi:hypothetical protein